MRSSTEELKHLARYLKGEPSVALVLGQQRTSKTLRMRVDSDFAADRRTTRSTTGMVQRFGILSVKLLRTYKPELGLRWEKQNTTHWCMAQSMD